MVQHSDYSVPNAPSTPLAAQCYVHTLGKQCCDRTMSNNDISDNRDTDHSNNNMIVTILVTIIVIIIMIIIPIRPA